MEEISAERFEEERLIFPRITALALFHDWNADDSGRQVSQYCLGLPTVLSQVLQQFSTKELIKVSLVNKLWNYEARKVMRERGNVRAHLNKIYGADDPCQNLVEFASDLGKMCVVPFYGIHVDILHANHCRSTWNGLMDRAYKEILDRLPWKCFSVGFSGDWEKFENCPALAFVQKILDDNCGVLEELTIGKLKDEFYPNVFQGRSWPFLKTLNIWPCDPHFGEQKLTSTLLKTLVPFMPSLEELRVDKPINLKVNVLEGSSAVLVPFYILCPQSEPICEGLIGSFRAICMDIRIGTYRTASGLQSAFILNLLEASRTTLKALIMDLVFAVPLMVHGICLENVIELEIVMNGGIHESILELAKRLDLTRIFPKLTQVKIKDDGFAGGPSLDVVRAFTSEGNAVLSRELPDRAINIETLKFIEFRSTRDSTLPFLAQMFPHVKKVYIINTPRFWFENLREHFLCLEEKIEIPFRGY